jgi:Family of unknown function (DUF5681)
MDGEEESADNDGSGSDYAVGFRRPPLHTRFKPGVSGNPSGRRKDSKNLKTLLNAILNEQISLQEGSQSKKISKAEAIMRRLIIGALKGDSRDLHALFRLAEQTGQFAEEDKTTSIEVVRFSWEPPQPSPMTSSNSDSSLPAINQLNRD